MKILQRTIIIQPKLLVSSVSRQSTASSHCLNNEITKVEKHLKRPSRQLMLPVPNFYNLLLLQSRRFSTSRLGLNQNNSKPKQNFNEIRLGLNPNNSKGKRNEGTFWNPRGLTGHPGKKHKQGDQTVVFMILAILLIAFSGIGSKVK